MLNVPTVNTLEFNAPELNVSMPNSPGTEFLRHHILQALNSPELNALVFNAPTLNTLESKASVPNSPGTKFPEC